ncbi:DUF2806 domain-containing protein [uncultured Sphaerochaeta sp.]|uniref:DUF2806 domain-containing protein n=1 Tax=uncultured Sphaerochaeta sp. TaxID=886478 RepID=UPI002AA5FC0A|nr:DUF2806 domain-containing protein [uncultured Sphaerochaeta sp.]
MSSIEGLTKAIFKMIEVCANGIGIIYEPRHLIKMAEAYKKAQDVLDSSNTHLTYNDGKITINPTPSNLSIQPTASVDSIEVNSLNRINYQKSLHQENIEKIIGFAVNQLNPDEEISEAPVDRSWSDTFFNDAAHIYDQDLQILWGRILAGEVAKPGKYSLRTLSILRTLSKKDAELFERISKTVFSKGNVFFILSEFELSIYNTYSLIEKEHLASLGLLTSEDLHWNLFTRSKEPETFTYGNLIVFMTLKPEKKNFPLHFYNLSQVGIELMSILPDRNFQYLKAISDYYKPKGVILEYSKITYVRDGINNYSLPKKSFQ